MSRTTRLCRSRSPSALAGTILLVALTWVLASCVAPDDSPAAASGDSAGPLLRTQPSPKNSDREEPDPRKSITVALAGDVLVHTGVWETAERDAARRGRRLPYFTPMFAGVRQRVSSADLAICHLETPVAPKRGPYLNYPLFSAPPTVLDGLKATGFDVCTTASNHSVDMGFTGLARTARALDDRGIAHTGTYARQRNAGRPLEIKVDGVRVALISMTFGTNGMPVTQPWSVNLIDVPRVLRQAARLRENGTDVVMVAVHAGTEYSSVPNQQQVEVFRRLARSPDITFVYGHHAHVVQDIERVHHKWVFYGLGNFVAQQLTSIPDTYRAMIADITFVERADGSFVARHPRFAPTVITHPTRHGATRVFEAARVLADPDSPQWLRGLARRSIAAVSYVVREPGVERIGVNDVS